MIRKTYAFLASLSFGLWLMGGVMALLAAGSFVGGEQSALNAMPLFAWLGQAPVAASWWLWGALALLGLLVCNTVLCSVETLRQGWGERRLLQLLAPQLMHLGFLLIVLAHLLSARGGAKEAMQVDQGSVLSFPDGSSVRVTALATTPGPMGMPVDFSAGIVATAGGRQTTTILRPNHPFFHDGVGIYLKHVEPFPVPVGYVELHYEPGAGWALAGALLFTAGNVALLAVRRGRPLAG
ncbi:cytochrome c biogenesis protein ResB [Geobacter pickeringii]|uniref:Cytochrome C biogenesis protein ResB n=1 Tax=Geobacter pickeringii TaxID=345632 RepID=A0A0B5BAU3_9BACT|nr:cytochrome c biogenesis protein ResB [Geobacter pickeringii]AJE02079.1 cytochrome C biogenesis protein ResB [Geobacter pickeringii]